MRKLWMLVAFCVAVGSIFTSEAFGKAKKIYIGINAPMTGDIPKVGEGSKYAAEMWLADINAAGGLKVQHGASSGTGNRRQRIEGRFRRQGRNQDDHRG